MDYFITLDSLHCNSVATSNDFPQRKGHLLDNKMKRRSHPSSVFLWVNDLMSLGSAFAVDNIGIKKNVSDGVTEPFIDTTNGCTSNVWWIGWYKESSDVWDSC